MIETTETARTGPRKHHRLGLANPEKQLDISRDWFTRAKKSLAGGISSSARSTATGPIPHPQYFSRGQGARIFDEDGNEFIDYLLAYGSAILGHANPAIVDAVSSQLKSGTMFGTCNTAEVELAEQIVAMVPCADLVRYANSGSEAILGAVRAARGFTGKTKILKFEGHYHGWVDVLAVSNRPTDAEAGTLEHPKSAAHSRGMPASVVNDVVICPWNQPKILRQILDAHRDEFAAMICEPIVANNACTMPADGFLQLLRDECTARGIVLIFDEIVTGFRLAPGGAQEFFGVQPDVAVFSKAIGGGFPISAFAGKRAVMEPIGANTVKHGGTYNGNPLCAVAALTTLRALADRTALDRMRTHGEALIESVRRSARDCRVPLVVQGAGAMFQIVFGLTTPSTHYRDLRAADTNRFAAFRHELLQRGIHSNSAHLACWFISTAHDSDDIAITTSAIDESMKAIA